LAQLAVGLVDRLEKVLEAGRLVDRPQAGETMAEQLHLTLGEQTDSNDPFLRQSSAPTM
jgi:ornithine cyclodeaminase/alanine dehydrogenase-like protein (mu-crystallin family)